MSIKMCQSKCVDQIFVDQILVDQILVDENNLVSTLETNQDAALLQIYPQKLEPALLCLQRQKLNEKYFYFRRKKF